MSLKKIGNLFTGRMLRDMLRLDGEKVGRRNPLINRVWLYRQPGPLQGAIGTVGRVGLRVPGFCTGGYPNDASPD